MTSFAILAAIMLAAALGFVLPALLRNRGAADEPAGPLDANLAVLRDQVRELDADLAAGTLDARSHAEARNELERRALEAAGPVRPPSRRQAGRWMPALLLGAAMTVGAPALYRLVGAPAAFDPAPPAVEGNTANAASLHQIGGMVQRLAQRLQDKPDDVEGWMMLARSYNTLGQHAKATEVYARLVSMRPDDAELLASYADTLAMASGKTLQGEPERLIARALLIDPNNVKARVLSGSAAFERGDYAAALERWQASLPLVTPGSDMAKLVQGNIDEATALAHGKPGAQPAAALAPAGMLQGIVELDPALRSQLADSATVFIFARSAQGGPRFPLAVLRKQVKDLPLAFVLDDSLGIVPGTVLSSVSSVMVGARISTTGSATPNPDDPVGMIGPVATGTANLKIRISARAADLAGR